MIYSNFQNKNLSLLGFATMRLPTNIDGSIDETQVKEMTRFCIDVPAAMKDLTEKISKLPSWAEICRQREAAANKKINGGIPNEQKISCLFFSQRGDRWCRKILSRGCWRRSL